MKSKMGENHNNESKIRKVLFNEISFIIAGIALVSSVIFWVTNPQNELRLQVVKLQSQVESNQVIANELSLIKNNDLKEIQLRMDRIESRQIEQLQAISRIEALIGNKN